MEKEILPTGKAHEPNEGARNPMARNTFQRQDEISSRKCLTFSDDTNLSERTASQKSFKEALSQPTPGLSHRQKLIWLQKRRTRGLWAQCDSCEKWRFLPQVLDRHELPEHWYCHKNPDASHANCSVAETPIRVRDEEALIHSEYSAGSLVCARMLGWPWWPAMVDDCPDTEQFYWLDGFSDIPTYYNVVFFDSSCVTRGWITPNNLKPYSTNKNIFSMDFKNDKYINRLQLAITQADDAMHLSLEERLSKYSFIAKYTGDLNSPKKITKKELIKHQRKMKIRFNLDFNTEASELNNENDGMSKINVVTSDTAKSDKTKIVQDSLNIDENLMQDDMDLTFPSDLPFNNTPNKTQRNVDVIDVTPTLPPKRQKTVKGIQDGTNPNTNELSTNDLKQFGSMAVEVGSRTEIIQETESYDNDTSKTYVPDVKQTLESTDTATATGTQDLEIRTVSPKSDDFDF